MQQLTPKHRPEGDKPNIGPEKHRLSPDEPWPSVPPTPRGTPAPRKEPPKEDKPSKK